MISFLLDTLVATGVLIALVLVLRKPVARAFGPGLAYTLWLLPLLRFVMPPILLPASFAPAEPAAAVLAEAPAEAVIPMVSPVPTPEYATMAEPAASASIPWAGLLLAVWLGGALLFLAWRFVSYRRMRADLLAEARPVGEVGAIRLVESPAVTGPVAFGILDKVVALPLNFMALEDRTARDLAIAHELAHHRGRDLAANILAQPLLALHWFNPLAWLAWRAMRRDQEAACDARVIAAQGRHERARYAEVIASFAAGPRLALAAPMACPMRMEKSIVHRLRSLTMDDVSRRRRLFGRALLVAGGMALPLSATVTYAASDAADVRAAESGQPRQASEHRMVIVDVDEGADPDDADLHTRMVTRDGKTVVLKTDKALSDAEAAERVDRALASMERMGRRLPPVPPAPPAPPAPDAPVAPVPPAPPAAGFGWNPHDPDFEQKMEAWGKEMERWGEEFGERYAAQAQAQAELAQRNAPQVVHSCRGNPQSVTRHETTADGRQKIIICERVAKRQALGGLRSARNTIARDRQIDPQVRDEVLQELDSEIERIESDS